MTVMTQMNNVRTVPNALNEGKRNRNVETVKQTTNVSNNLLTLDLTALRRLAKRRLTRLRNGTMIMGAHLGLKVMIADRQCLRLEINLTSSDRDALRNLRKTLVRNSNNSNRPSLYSRIL